MARRLVAVALVCALVWGAYDAEAAPRARRAKKGSSGFAVGSNSDEYHAMAWAAARSSNLVLLEKAIEQQPLLLNGREPRSGQTLLMAATLAGQPDAVRMLLDAGADPSIGEKDGYTPFHGAGFQGRPEVARVLIEAGLDAQNVHQDGYQGIHRACWGREKRHAETVRVLIEEGGVPWDVRDRMGNTPLDHVKQSGNQDTVHVLTAAKLKALQRNAEL